MKEFFILMLLGIVIVFLEVMYMIKVLFDRKGRKYEKNMQKMWIRKRYK